MPCAVAPEVDPGNIAGILAHSVASYASPEVSVISICALAVAYTIVRYALPWYWPDAIMRGSLAKCKEAKSSLEDLRLGQLNERQLEIWDKLSDFKNKVYNLRDRHDEVRNAGVLRFLRALRGLYTEACTLKREADKIMMDFERLA
ncbi:hypothetical protein BDZ89DRAFT_1078065 [Hymenopellis radicata]|nr:hypothetical protein BDZ89DRAFT_1078065 [Hymenopellis radicata]